MAKFGFFLQGGTKPALEFEGDKLYFNATAVGMVEVRNADNRTTAVIRLGEGQSVKEISEGESGRR